MARDDDDSPVSVLQLEMAPVLTDVLETDVSKGPRRLLSGNGREPRRHAAISTVSIRGG